MPVWRVFSPSSPPRPLKPAPSVPHRPQKGLVQSFPRRGAGGVRAGMSGARRQFRHGREWHFRGRFFERLRNVSAISYASSHSADFFLMLCGESPSSHWGGPSAGPQGQVATLCAQVWAASATCISRWRGAEAPRRRRRFAWSLASASWPGGTSARWAVGSLDSIGERVRVREVGRGFS